MKPVFALSMLIAASVAHAGAPAAGCVATLEQARLTGFEIGIALGPPGTRAQFPANDWVIRHKLERAEPGLLPMRGLRERCAALDAVAQSQRRDASADVAAR